MWSDIFLDEVIESLRFHQNNMGRVDGGIDEIRLAGCR